MITGEKIHPSRPVPPAPPTPIHPYVDPRPGEIEKAVRARVLELYEIVHSWEPTISSFGIFIPSASGQPVELRPDVLVPEAIEKAKLPIDSLFVHVPPSPEDLEKADLYDKAKALGWIARHVQRPDTKGHDDRCESRTGKRWDAFLERIFLEALPEIETTVPLAGITPPAVDDLIAAAVRDRTPYRSDDELVRAHTAPWFHGAREEYVADVKAKALDVLIKALKNWLEGAPAEGTFAAEVKRREALEEAKAKRRAERKTEHEKLDHLQDEEDAAAS